MWTIHLPDSVVCNPVERSRLQKTTIITTWRVERDASCSPDSCLLEKSNGGQTPLDANDKSLLIRGALIVIYREVKHCRRKSQRGHRLNCTVIIFSHHNVPKKLRRSCCTLVFSVESLHLFVLVQMCLDVSFSRHRFE